MKKRLLNVCFAGLALSAAGLANADPVKIFTPQLTSHAAISGAAVSIAADSVVDGNLAAQAAVTIGAGFAEAQDIYAGAAVTTGASSTVKNIYAGAAAGIGAVASAQNINAGAAITLGASANVQLINAGAAITFGAGASGSEEEWMAPSNVAFGDIHTATDMTGALAQIAIARQALATLSTPPITGDAHATHPLLTTMGGHISLAPGVHYGSALTLAANSTVTFIPTDSQGNHNGSHHVYIVNLSDALTVGADTTFVLEDDEGHTATIIWNVGAAVTLGAGTDFIGTAFVGGAFNAATSDVSCGNIYASGAVSVGSIGSLKVDGDPDKCPSTANASPTDSFAIRGGQFSVAADTVTAVCEAFTDSHQLAGPFTSYSSSDDHLSIKQKNGGVFSVFAYADDDDDSKIYITADFFSVPVSTPDDPTEIILLSPEVEVQRGEGMTLAQVLEADPCYIALSAVELSIDEN
jgi:hypothetical protein